MEPFNHVHYSKLAEENRKRVEKTNEFNEPDRVPVIIEVGGPYYAKIFGYTFADYYNDLEVMLDVQVKGIKWRLGWLKDDFCHIGVGLDVGSVAEGIVFDCEVKMPNEHNPWRSPWTIPKIRSLEDIDNLEVPDPRRNRRVREYYERLENFMELVRKNYEGLHVGGMLQIHPPISAAGSLMGTGRLYSWLYKHPNEMRKLFDKLEETFRALQDYYSEIFGNGPGGLGLADDHSGYLNRRMYETFTMPYNSRLYDLYGTNYRSLHMDSHLDHITDILVEVYKVDEVDVGVENDVRVVANAFKGKVLFNGNADWRALLKGSHELVELEVERCIYFAAPGGGYIFDNGGETYAGVPAEMLKYEVEYAKSVGRYPIKLENFKYSDELHFG